ncbi:MAG TPA: hypothetical protein VEY95_06110 [Azospirillaceae bacterium]|nr:hypothetical protein [Azospirillaceae bacterium]
MMVGERVRRWLAVAVLAGMPAAVPAAPAGTLEETVADRGCATLSARVDEVPGDGPVFLRSYDGPVGRAPPAEPALATAAFTYDNALAAIALTACGRSTQARRIGLALLAAATSDRSGERGRLRNAYRAGVQREMPVPPNGWWHAAGNHWAEDPIQVGTATGNVAWAALALLTLADDRAAQPDEAARFREGAAALAAWTVTHTAAPRGDGGFTGGMHGYDDAPRTLGWKSTEHNTDLAALFEWLARTGVPGDWPAHARAARTFLAAQWDASGGRFLIGTGPDGTPNRRVSGLDAQLWPLLLPGAPIAWGKALAYAERAHGVEDGGVAVGFDFNDDRDGLWVEGTAQAALVYRRFGRGADAGRLLAEVARQFGPGGYLWATREPRITTGLALAPDSTGADFHYERRPHLGATAWAVLAATGWNPFTGTRIP